MATVLQVLVKTISGRCLVLDLSPRTTIRELKERIEEKEQISPEQQKLAFAGLCVKNYYQNANKPLLPAGQVLENPSLSLQHYKVTNGATIHLVITSSGLKGEIMTIYVKTLTGIIYTL